MAKLTNVILVTPDETIISKIYMIRGQKVMLDDDLAELYGVETKQLKRQFELTVEEYQSLRSQIGTIKRGEHTKYRPFAFTEQGVSMLSGVLNSPLAIQVHIQIIRVFSKNEGDAIKQQGHTVEAGKA